MLEEDDLKLSEAVQENSKEIQESIEILNQFEKFLTNINATDVRIINSDRLFLKLLKYKIDLDTSLDHVERSINMLSEILDQSDLGLASRFMFSHETLANSVTKLYEKFSDLSPIFKTEKVDKYFSLTLTLTHVTENVIKSLIRIPMVDTASDFKFKINQQDFHQGLVTLESSHFRIYLTFSQYKKQCLKDVDKMDPDKFCLIRPCLIKIDTRDRDSIVQCISINETSYLVSNSEPILVTSSCSGSTKVLEISNVSEIQVPKHCQLNSRNFFIKPITRSRGQNTSIKHSTSRNITDDYHKFLVNLLNISRTGDGDIRTNKTFPLYYYILAIGGPSLAAISIITLAILTIIAWKRKSKTSQANNDQKKKIDYQNDFTNHDNPPPPYHDNDDEHKIEFSGLLEINCEVGEKEKCDDCSGISLNSSMLKMVEQNLKHSLNLPLDRAVNLDVTTCGRDAFKIISFSTRYLTNGKYKHFDVLLNILM